MTIPEIVYLAAFIAVIGSCAIYIFRVNAREARNRLPGHRPASKEASILLATEERESSGKPERTS